MLDFFGRLHPLVLHLPIGILAFAYMLELYSLIKKENFTKVQSLVLFFAAAAATVSIITGLLLTRGGDYGGSLVDNHKWVAIGLGAICWALYFIQRSGLQKAYYTTLISSAVMLGVTGHLGGSITHGEDFLFKGDGVAVKPKIEEAELYADIIHPIFEDKCISCHNPNKLKGEFNMSDSESFLKGGENGKVILASEPMDSPLLLRMHLPMNDEEHMPPESKKQLTEDEIKLIEWWISSGADFDKLAIETEGFSDHSEMAKKFLAPPELDIFAMVPTPDSSDLSRLTSQGIKLYPTHSGSSAIYVNLSDRSDISASEVKQLRSIRKNVAHLNLAGTGFDDGMVKKLNGFKHLNKLELQNTKITSNGVNQLADFEFLQTLNLYGTAVDSSIIEKVISFPQLETLYLWETKMEEKDIEKIKAARPRLNVIYEINKDIFGDAALKAPLINADSDIFKDSLEVSLDLNFRDVVLSYMINGGDTITYNGPFKIGSTATIAALAQKEGWQPSEVNERTFIKQGFPIKQVKFNVKPHKQYTDIARTSLNNLKIGSERFRDGEWVGYEAKDASITVMLDEVSTIKEIAAGFLERTSSYIFYPTVIKISISKDGVNFKEVAKEKYIMPTETSRLGRKNFSFKIDPQEVKWVKIDAESLKFNPDWHAAPGAKNWIFIDEIIIN